jgi:hypothetical protein
MIVTHPEDTVGPMVWSEQPERPVAEDASHPDPE